MTQIPASAFAFLRALRENNNRPWFNDRKEDYLDLKRELRLFFSEVADLLLAHDDIEKWRMYRIHRDLRFSKDKTPYKKYFAAQYGRQKPQLRGGYYIHIEPNHQSFVEAGFWGPNRADLLRVRREWEMDAGGIRAIISKKSFKHHWGEMLGEQLKTAPSGFSRDHADIDLINFKQWRFAHYFSDEEVLSDHFAETVDEYYQAIRPFFDYMSEVLTTNLNGESLH